MDLYVCSVIRMYVHRTYVTYVYMYLLCMYVCKLNETPQRTGLEHEDACGYLKGHVLAN